VLNIATQDIINSIIKIEDPLEDLEAIKAIEEEEDLEEKDIFINKLIILILL
jgi:hypothetical protein